MVGRIYRERHVLDGPEGQKFESTWIDRDIVKPGQPGVCGPEVRSNAVFCRIGRFQAQWQGGDHVTDSSVVEIQGRQLKLSNLHKVLYPVTGFTKKDVIDYYVRIAPGDSAAHFRAAP